jgi:hypothetical protein
LNIENLPAEIDGYKLYIYEVMVLAPWGLIVKNGKLNREKLLNIFDNQDKIKHYEPDENLEYQFVIVYEKNEHLLFGETPADSLPNCLTSISARISDYKKSHQGSKNE